MFASHKPTIMKTTKIISVLIAIFALAFVSTLESCSKVDDTSNSQAVNKTSLLSSAGWVLKSATMDMGLPTGPMDMYSLMDQEDKDDLMMFNADKTVSRDAGTELYAAAIAQVEEKGSWSLKNNDSEIVITENNEVTEMKLVALSANELVLEATEYDEMLEQNTTLTFTYSH